MLDSVVTALPVTLLPHVSTILFVLIGLLVLMAVVSLMLLNRIVIGVICIALATAVWIVTPEISDRAEIRHLQLEGEQSVKPHEGSTPGKEAAKPLEQRLKVTYFAKGYINIELDGQEKSLLPGESFEGIRLISVSDKAAVLEIDGKQFTRLKPKQ
jgi:hypothetical protein